MHCYEQRQHARDCFALLKCDRFCVNLKGQREGQMHANVQNQMFRKIDIPFNFSNEHIFHEYNS